MSENSNRKVNLVEIEVESERLTRLLADSNSNRLLLFAISDFFETLLQTKNKTILDAYLPQYINVYKKCLNTFDPFFISPIATEKAIETAKLICKAIDVNEDKNFITEQINSIEIKSNELNKELTGNNSKELKGLYFPVLEQEIIQSKETFGLLESLTVQIRKAKNETKFLVIPSELHLEQKIQQQIDNSWLKAIDFLKENKIKIPEKNYEVLIAFDLKEGIIIGNSLGIVLSISFIQELLKYYTSSLIVNSKDNIALTGGLDDSGKIVSTSKEIIRIKTDIVFYSSIKIFCIPKVNEIDANERLFELKQQYPNRGLEIIGLTDLKDLLNRRNVVDVHKKNLIQIIATYIIKKWKSILLAIVLSIVFSFLFVLDFDDNPAMFEQDLQLLQVKNKNGKVLWSVVMNFYPLTGLDQSTTSRKIVDIDNDGMNEVLICEENLSPEIYNYGRLACYNYRKEIVWEYVFRDTVSTFRKWGNLYHISIIDTITLKNIKLVVCSSRNIPNFPSAVFKIDLLTGKRVDSLNTLWNAGTFNTGIIGDYNKDGKKEIVLGGLHNGYQRAILVSIDIENLYGQTPSPDRYKFINKPLAKVNEFILLPNSDYGKLYARSNSVAHQHLYYKERSEEFETATIDGSDKGVLFYYGFDKDLNLRWIDCGDDAQLARDSLVAKGVLNKPFTNSNDYFDLLRNQIEYWDGEKFVNIDKREK